MTLPSPASCCWLRTAPVSIRRP
ncbi:hypothetical protein R2601_03148 [Salipiger bermudensis HTCC2601]|uniref:Uncharacterized protein n=1 Tax=Salipiger bermudensis (strain DSM 26914 / JCM 13377 / KCTC 12554 / HTCC2601) TaxID=314265 RepID=Q0FWL6_SALBH|nr:hypothetical protein R2601_03148 [Salipiger bermudensis HTCC2601]